VVLPEVTGIALTGSYRVLMRNRFPRFFLTIVVVQNVVQIPWLPEVTEGHVTPKGVPLGVRMRNRKLCNIRPSGAF